MLCGRVSTRKQDDDGRLKRQIDRLRKAVEKMGVKNIIDGPIVEVSLGKVNRSGLEFIILLAEKLGAIAVFETTNRIIRAKDFCPKTNPTAQLTLEDFEELTKVTKGVPLATVLHPDADYIEIKCYQSKYEEKKKDRILYDKSKPGWTKRRRKKYLPIVLKLRAEGMSYGAIAKQLDLSIDIVRSWCRKYSE
jgi:DNA invertase Pin-like site-specific DNA recombinase